MHVVHLTASTFFGGPERQMLGLAEARRSFGPTSILSFSEGGRGADFIHQAQRRGFPAQILQADTPYLVEATAELTRLLRQSRAEVLLCHGYKANLVGRLAARRIQRPAVAVSRGWTWESWKMRLYETIDRVHLKSMDHVVAVSAGQAAKVRHAGVPRQRLSIIHNSSRMMDLRSSPAVARERLRALFPRPPEQIVLAAGRLSPEKGYDVLLRAAPAILQPRPNVGLIHFGDGMERGRIEQLREASGVPEQIVLAGFTAELDQLLPGADVMVLPSYTEGLPNVVLEAGAAGVPVVATAVGGTPEAIHSGRTGILIPPGDPSAIATAVNQLLDDPQLARKLGAAAQELMREQFTFEAQARLYEQLFTRLHSHRRRQVA
ncbi:MAG: glycosyltransferase family 4 protein [Gemmataceae bacterium]